VSDRSDNDLLPGLKDEHTEEDMGQEIYKRDHIDSGVQPRAPGGPIKEKRAGDSSELMQNTIDSQTEENKVPEDHVTHWQEQEISDLRAIAMEWQTHAGMRRQEQAQVALDMFKGTWEHYLSGNETEDDNISNGPEYWESVD
jgi:hypothetical protein